MIKYIICIWLCISAMFVNGQDLSGVWQGKLTQGPGGCFPEYYIELQIQSTTGEISGISYDYYDTSLFVKLNFIGKFNGNKRSILLNEYKVVTEKIPDDCTPCLKTYDLVYSKQNEVESLTGKWVGEDIGTITGCPPGFIFLRKVKTSAFEKRYRETEITKIITLNSPDITIELFDNGIVDGDSVSVMYNNQLVVSKKGLSLKPILLTYTLQPLKEYDMVVVAESMGSISPATALVVITSGLKRHEVLISSDEKKNAAIRFVYVNK